MKREFVIVTDSTTDLPHELAKKLGLVIMPLAFTLENQTYRNTLDNKAMDPHDFYERVHAGAMPITTQVNPDEYMERLRPILVEGKDILILGFSSALSGTFNSARLAKEMLDEEFPERQIIAIDTLSASMGEGLLVYLAAQKKQSGKTLEEVADFVLDTRLKICHWFTVTDIAHLKRGGRLSGAAAFVAEMLKIQPILHVDKEGRLIPRNKVIGRKKALRALVDKMLQTVDKDVEQTIMISHGDDLEAATFVKSLIEAELPVKEIIINYIGPVIGAHAGPGTIALFYQGLER